MSETFTHRPVLLDECIQALAIRPEGIYLDGTLGRAGHSREIARRLTTGRLICVDRDQAALEAAEERLAQWRDRVTLVHSNFDQIDRILNELSLSGPGSRPDRRPPGGCSAPGCTHSAAPGGG